MQPPIPCTLSGCSLAAPCPPSPPAQVEPKQLTITNFHVIAASDEAVYVWQFRTSFSKFMSTDVSGVKRKDVREKTFHIDNANPAQVGGPLPCMHACMHLSMLASAYESSHP